VHSLVRMVAPRFGRIGAIAAVLSIAATSLVASPVAASTPPPSDYGNTATCRYTAPGNGPSYNFRIKKIVVTAPTLYAKNGTQTVGWRFVVARSKSYGDDPWKITYRSPVEKATATTSQAAPFTTKSVDVAIPDVQNVGSVQYHATLKLYWYRPDGSVQSKTSYSMPYMGMHSRFDDDYETNCPAGYYQGP
jgi:hypothetical protein